MVRRRAVPASLLLLTLFGLTAFAAEQPNAVFAPFVSRLKATVADYQIKLTWKDSSDVQGEDLLYRSTEEITDANLDKATLLARIPLGVEYYIDTPPDEKGYFYAVLVQDTSKRLYRVLIPFRNKTSLAISVATTATEEQLASRITGIKAVVSAAGDAINLSFTSSNPSRDLLVFWSTAPLSLPEDLLRGTSKVSIDPGVTMYPVAGIPGVDYYFAILDAGLYKVGKSPLELGQNVTIQPAQIPLPVGASPQPALPPGRPLPLPPLQLTKTIESGRDLPSDQAFALPEQRNVSLNTGRAITQILSAIKLPPPPEMELEILESDLTPATSGQLASLQFVVTNQFAKKNFADAERLIRDFLSLPRKPEVEARARFYLGEITYFQNKPRDAAMEFLLAEDYLYHDTQPWLDACFRKLEASAQ